MAAQAQYNQAQGEEPQFDLSLKLSKAERADLGKQLRVKIMLAIQKRELRDMRIRQWRSAYEATTFPKSWPWPNSACLNVPVTRSTVDTLHAQAMRVVTGAKPYFAMEALSADADEEERTIKIDRLINWQLTEQVNYRAVLDMAYFAAFRDGDSIIKVPWLETKRRRRSLQGFSPNRSLVEEEETVSRPDPCVIDILDWVMYPANAKSIDTAVGCGHRMWEYEDNLLRKAQDSLYPEEWVKDLLAAKPDTPKRDSDKHGGYQATNDNIGVPAGDAEDSKDRPFELYEVIWRYCPDGGWKDPKTGDIDLLQRDCLFVVEMSRGMLCRAIQYPYDHGMRCYEHICPYPRDNAFYGYAVPEILEEIQAEINAIRNQRVDAGTLVLSPMIARRRGARWDPGKQPWQPGGVADFDDPANDWKPMNMPSVGQQAFAEEQLAREMAERVTGVSDMAQGASPSRSRPLGETYQIIDSGNNKFNVVCERLQDSNTNIVFQILELDRQYLPVSVEFAITQDGERLFESITADDLKTKTRIVPRGNALTTNKEIELQMAETLFQMSQTSPLIAADLGKQWHVLLRYLTAAGIINPIVYIGRYEEALQMQKAKANQQSPLEQPKLTAKVDEMTALALVLKENPDLGPYLQQAFMIQNAASQGFAAGQAKADNDAAQQQIQTQGQGALQQMLTDEAQHQQGMQHRAQEHGQKVAHRAHDTVHRVAGQAIQQAAQQALQPPPAPGMNGAQPEEPNAQAEPAQPV